MRGVQGQESRQVYEGVFSRAKALQRAVAARVLRAGSSDEGVALVLTELAAVEDRGDRYDRALAYREEAGRRAGDKTSASDWLDLAEDYDRTLDATRGRAAAERAAGAPRPASMTPSDLADDPRAWPPSVGPPRRSRRPPTARPSSVASRGPAPCSRSMGRPGDRRPRGAAPGGSARRAPGRRARPGELPQGAPAIDLDLIRSAAHAIDDAASFEHREDEYFEDALGLSGALLFQEKVLLWAKDPPGQTSMLLAALKDLGDRARALRPFDPGRAGASATSRRSYRTSCRTPAAPTKAPILARVRRCAAESRDLLREFPDAIDVAKVALTCAYFEDDAELAVAQADSPPPRGAKDTTEMLHDRLAEHLVLTAREHEGDKAKGEAALEAAAAIAADADAAPGADHADIAALRGTPRASRRCGPAARRPGRAPTGRTWPGSARRGRAPARPQQPGDDALPTGAGGRSRGALGRSGPRHERRRQDGRVEPRGGARGHRERGRRGRRAGDVPRRRRGGRWKYQALAWLIALEKRKPKAKQSRASIVKWAKAAVSLESKSGWTQLRFASGEEGMRPKQSVQLSMGWSVRDGALGFPLRSRCRRGSGSCCPRPSRSWESPRSRGDRRSTRTPPRAPRLAHATAWGARRVARAGTAGPRPRQPIGPLGRPGVGWGAMYAIEQLCEPGVHRETLTAYVDRGPAPPPASTLDATITSVCSQSTSFTPKASSGPRQSKHGSNDDGRQSREGVSGGGSRPARPRRATRSPIRRGALRRRRRRHPRLRW